MLSLYTEKRITEIVAHHVRERRLEANLSQKSLSARSGVKLPTLKHFEQTGQISLFNLALLATVLGRSDDLLLLFKEKAPTSIAELEAKTRKRKRGRG